MALTGFAVIVEFTRYDRREYRKNDEEHRRRAACVRAGGRVPRFIAAMAPPPSAPSAPTPTPPVQVFVFDDRLGKKEGEELEKVLAFFPHGAHPNTMAASVGLVEGVTGKWGGRGQGNRLIPHPVVVIMRTRDTRSAHQGRVGERVSD